MTEVPHAVEAADDRCVMHLTQRSSSLQALTERMVELPFGDGFSDNLRGSQLGAGDGAAAEGDNARALAVARRLRR